MNKIIKGKKYDTKTAELIRSYSNSAYTSDFNWYQDSLYRKKTGEFFLYGEGGPASKWSESCGGNEYCGGNGIEPLSDAEAKEWVESYANDLYEEIFGNVEE